MMGNLAQDIRYAVRTLLKMPGFAAAAICTLALAIGANTAFFSVIKGILLEPLPYPEPYRIVVVSNTYNARPSSNSVPDYLDRVRDAKTVDSVAAFTGADFNLTTESVTAHVSGASITPSLFNVLLVRPAIGRQFNSSDSEAGAPGVVILSDGTWRQYFGGDPQIVGKQVMLNSQPHAIVGVMPPTFRMPEIPAQILRPLVFTAAQMSETSRGNEFLTNIGRIKNGMSVDQVRAEMQTLAARAVENGGARRQFLINAKFSADVSSLTEQTIGTVRRPLLVLLGATGLVLLIALANVANLLLARASARRREVFIRAALGAARSRLMAQLLTESVLLSMIGGMIGLAFSYWGVKSLVAAGLDGIPRLNDVAVDGGVIAFAFMLSIGTGIVFGAVPAWTMSGLSYGRAHAGDRSAASSGQRVRHGAVIVQVSVAQILLVAAALLVGSLQRLMAVDPGFRTESRMAFRVSLPAVTYPTPESQAVFFDQLIARLESIPGVRSAGISQLSPFDVHNETATFHVEGYEEPAGSKPLGSEMRRISGAYPASIGMPLIAGRTFDDRDRIGSPYVVMVDRRTAEQFWPGQSPLGKRLRFGTAWREVVGVVGSVKNERLDAEGQYQIYIPFAQFPERNMIVVMHAETDPAAAIRSATETVSGLDRSVPVFDIRTLEERVRQSLALRRYSMMLLAGFGLSGLLVAIIGIYGVIAYSVRQRTQEIGIRLALGAQRQQLVRSIVGQGMMLGMVGIGVGAAGAFWLTRFMESMLYGVTATDPLTFIMVAATLLTAAAFAAYLPASKASRLDPARVLRGD